MIPVKPSIAAKAHVNSMEQYEAMYRRSVEQPEEFWREQAAILDWYHPPRSILDVDLQEVDFSWYAGGRLNASIGLFNATNSSAITTVETTYGSDWKVPRGVLAARTLQFQGSLTF